MVERLKYGGEKISEKLQLNFFITTTHISLIIIFTVSSIFTFNVPTTNGSNGDLALGLSVSTAWTMIGGVCDLFLTCFLWFIFDDKRSPNIFRQGTNSYAVIDVIKVRESTSVQDSSDSDEEDVSRGTSFAQSFRVCDLLVA